MYFAPWVGCGQKTIYMFNKTQIKSEYVAPEVRQVQAPVENGFALSHAERPNNSNIEYFGNSGNNYGNELF